QARIDSRRFASRDEQDGNRKTRKGGAKEKCLLPYPLHARCARSLDEDEARADQPVNAYPHGIACCRCCCRGPVSGEEDKKQPHVARECDHASAEITQE